MRTALKYYYYHSGTPDTPIILIGASPSQEVDYGTAFGSLTLPSTVTATLENLDAVQLEVTWNEGSYNGSVAGVYNLTGTVTLPAGVSNPENLTGTISIEVVQSTITYFASASNPADNGTLGANTVAVTPPASMLENDFVILTAGVKSGSSGIAISEAGGQEWNDITLVDGTGTRFQARWCVFNGTWGADPSVAITTAVATTAVMHVFRSSLADPLWQINVSQVSGTSLTITGVTTTVRSTLSIATWHSSANSLFTSLTGTGWVTTGSAQYRNLDGSDATIKFAHRILNLPQATGDVSVTASGTILSQIFSITDDGIPPVTLGDAYVVAIRGQSNQLSSNSGPIRAELQTAITDAHIFIGTTSFEVLDYSEGNHNPGGDPSDFGPILSCAYALTTANPGKKFFFCLEAQSGTSMHGDWNVAINAIGRASAKNVRNACIHLRNLGYNVIVIADCFGQGEADKGATNPNGLTLGVVDPSKAALVQSEYKDKGILMYQYLLDQLTSNGFSTANIKFICSLIDSPFTGDNTWQDEIVAAQEEIVTNFSGASFTTADLTMADQTHFSTEAQQTRGDRYAAEIVVP